MSRTTRFAIVAVVALAATACGVSPAGSKGDKTSLRSPAFAVVQPDPLVGPHAVQDAQHVADRLTFAPLDGSNAPMPLLAMSRGLSAPHGVASSQKREIFGFAPYWLLGHNSEWNYNLLSTVAYFGLDVQSDGTFAQSGNGFNGWNSADMTNLINNAHRAGTKVVVTIKDFNDASINMVDATSARQVLINNVIAAIQAKNLDGVNVDFEAVESTSFPDLQIGITTLMTELSTQVHAKWPQAEVTIDTYAGSASWDLGVFKIGDLAPVVDAMFIMNYDSVFSNMPGQAGPNSPMTHWTYNDTIDVAQYLSKAPASKILLGVPYYGYRWSTVSGAPYAATVGTKPIAEGYSAAMDDLACPHPALARGWDAWGESPWANWWSPGTNDPCADNFGYPQEMYYDDATSLGLKYDLINSSNLRGVGIWSLGMDSGRSELWSALSTYFSCPVSVTAPAAPATTEFSLSLTAGPCSVAYYDVQQFDTTTNQGWFTLGQARPSAGTANAVVEGYPGHTYQFQARAHTTGGLVSSWNVASSAVAAGAAYSHPFKGLYTLDAYGGISSDDSPPLAGTAYWPGWKIACAAKAQPGAGTPQAGLTMDCWGGLHSYGAPAITESSPGHYWPNWNIARDFAFLPDGTGGFVLDGWGGLHAFRVNGSTAPLAAQGFAYWPNWDIARKLVIFPDGSGGYVMDAWGGLHPFGINAPSPVSKVTQSAYWPNWNIARDLVLVPGNGSHSGYVLDGYGGLHPFHAASDGSTMPAAITTAYWGWDIARGAWFLPGSATAGYTLDGWGGPHPFGGAPAIAAHPYWPNQDIAEAVTGS